MVNIRSRLYFLVFFTLLPLLVYVSYYHYRDIKTQQFRAGNRLSEIATLTGAEHKQIVEGARQLLITLSTSPALTSHNHISCNQFLSKLKTNYQRYLNFGVVDSQGYIVCAADWTQATSFPPHRSLIEQALTSQDFTVGTYYPLDSGRAVINFGYPLSSTQLVYVSLSLDWVADFIASLDTPSDLVLNILDQNGVVLARRPTSETALGQNFATDPLVQEILSQGKGQTSKVGIDQILRLYAFTSLDDSKTTFIAVGTPLAQIYSDVQTSFLTSLLTLAGVALFSFFLANQVAKYLIINQLQALEKIDQLKDEFVSLASHQLRSPMTAIRWLSESLLDAPHSLTSPQQSALKKIHATTIRLIHLTSALLNISRLESGTLTPHPQLVDLTHLLAQILADAKPLARQARLRLLSDLPARLLVKTDLNLLGEIIRIILGNAIKYSHKGGIVKLTLRKSQDHLTLRITDHGIGIPVSSLPHLFTRFYRSETAKLHAPDGNGLGLYLAGLIAAKLSATLTINSRPGVATTATLTLPNEVS